MRNELNLGLLPPSLCHDLLPVFIRYNDCFHQFLLLLLLLYDLASDSSLVVVIMEEVLASKAAL